MSKRQATETSVANNNKPLSYQIIWVESTSNGALIKKMTITDEELYYFAIEKVLNLTHTDKVSSEEENSTLMDLHELLRCRSEEYKLYCGQELTDGFDDYEEKDCKKKFGKPKEFFLRGTVHEVEVHGILETKAPIVLVDSPE